MAANIPGRQDEEVVALSDFWCDRFAEAERRAPYSSRDGVYLRTIPSSEKIDLTLARSLLSQRLKSDSLKRCALRGKHTRKGWINCETLHLERGSRFF